MYYSYTVGLLLSSIIGKNCLCRGSVEPGTRLPNAPVVGLPVSLY